MISSLHFYIHLNRTMSIFDAWKITGRYRIFKKILNFNLHSKKIYASFGLLVIPSKLLANKKVLCIQNVPVVGNDPFQITTNVKNKERSMIANFIRNLRIGFRCFMLICIYAPLLIFYPLIKWNGAIRRRWWSVILFLIEHSGPVFVKFGQWASTRRDLFSLEFCKMFSQLHTRTRPHRWSYSEKLLKLTFGENWNELFAEFDKDPCGSGCVAQVYKARLDLDGPLKHYISDGMFAECDKSSADVAIKILHPNIETAVETDLSVLKIFTYCIDKVISRTRCLDLKKCVLEFEKTLLKQVDLNVEGNALKTFHKNFESDPNVAFPKPLFQSPCILIETFESGDNISNFVDGADQALKSELAQMGADSLLKMVFIDNFVHGDLHPGNIIVQEYDEPAKISNIIEWLKNLFRRNSSELIVVNRKRLVFLDAGITVRLSDHDLKNLRSVFKAVVSKNGKEVADLLLTQSPQQRCQDVEAFRRDVEKLVDDALDETVSLGQIRVASLLSDLLNIVNRNGVNLEPKFTSIVLSVMVLEGLGRTLDPNLDLIKCARKFLFRSLI